MSENRSCRNSSAQEMATGLETALPTDGRTDWAMPSDVPWELAMGMVMAKASVMDAEKATGTDSEMAPAAVTVSVADSGWESV